MKDAGIARRMTQVLIAAVTITVVAILAMSWLLHFLASSSHDLTTIARVKSKGSFELLGLVTKEQGLTQKMIQSNDPDAIEALIKEDDAVRKDARAKIKEITESDPEIVNAFEGLVLADEQVKDLLLHAHNAESHQAMVEKSNPAFEKVLGSIKSYQDKTGAELDKAASAASLRTNLTQGLLYLLVIGAVAALVVYGRRMVRSVASALNTVVERVKDVAEGEGDLTKRLEIHTKDELGELARWFNQFMEKLEHVMVEVAVDSRHLAESSTSISASAVQQAEGAEAQTEQTQQAAKTMGEMSAVVEGISENCTQAATMARNASEAARSGGKVVEGTLAKMRDISASVSDAVKKVHSLGERSQQISRITGVIEGIAHQTNLLALNAAIEASRAGEMGRGFAVVADEVRKLARRTSQATQEITTMVRGIQDETQNAVVAMENGARHVEAGVETTTQAGASLQEIIESAERVGEMVAQIASASTEHSAATQEVNRSIESISRISEESSKGAQQSAQACHQVSNMAQNLQQLVGQFKLEQDGKAKSVNGRGPHPGAQKQPWEDVDHVVSGTAASVAESQLRS